MKLIEVVADPTDRSVDTLEKYIRLTGDARPCGRGNFHIKSFGNCPEVVDQSIYMNNQPIRSLEGCPKVIRGTFDLSGCHNLKSLHDIHKHVHFVTSLRVGWDVTHVLGLMLIEGLVSLEMWHGGAINAKLGWSDILMKHYNSDERDITACQEELIDAGFSKQARL